MKILMWKLIFGPSSKSKSNGIDFYLWSLSPHEKSDCKTTFINLMRILHHDILMMYQFNKSSYNISGQMMGCCCACNVVCVSLLSVLLSIPLLAPIILSHIPVPIPSSNVTDSSSSVTTARPSILHSALSWLHVIPDYSHQDQVIDDVTKQVRDFV